MNKLLFALATVTLVAAPLVHASPEQDRQAMIQLYQQRFPDLKPGDYVYGALALSKDAMSQYKSIMDFPPFLDQVDAGKKLWQTPFRNGKTYASCFPNGGHNVAGNYPMYDAKLKKVVTFEMALNQCRVKNGEAPYDLADMKTMGRLDAYARSLSDGMKVNIKVDSPGALAKYEAGKKIYYQRNGQLNFACASCHVQEAGRTLRTELLSPVIGQATHWPVFRAGEALTTLQKRYVGCMKNVRAKPYKIGSEAFNDLEYFHTYLSNGLPMQANVYRK
jgi:L-cysteine S-thiosulfotransferase